MSDEKELDGYYVIKTEKYVELYDQINRQYHIMSELLNDHILKQKKKDWEVDPLKLMFKQYSILSELKEKVDDIANSPPKEVVKIAVKNKIKDILVHGETLAKLNALLLVSEENERIINEDYKISTVVH
jgi:hypothetical protein